MLPLLRPPSLFFLYYSTFKEGCAVFTAIFPEMSIIRGELSHCRLILAKTTGKELVHHASSL